MELNLFAVRPSHLSLGEARHGSEKNERVELEMKIMKYRSLARNAPDEVTTQRIKCADRRTEQKQREIDE